MGRQLQVVNTVPSQGDTQWKRNAKKEEDEEEERLEGVLVSHG